MLSTIWTEASGASEFRKRCAPSPIAGTIPTKAAIVASRLPCPAIRPDSSTPTRLTVPKIALRHIHPVRICLNAPIPDAITLGTITDHNMAAEDISREENAAGLGSIIVL